MVQRRAARFVKGDYDRTSSIATMLNELGWDTLQERRQHAKATMFYRIVYGLVCVPTTPFLIPATVSATRGHSMKYSRSTVVLECTHVFLFPEYHKDLEPTATAGCLSTQLRGLQAAAAEIHRVNNKVAF